MIPCTPTRTRFRVRRAPAVRAPHPALLVAALLAFLALPGAAATAEEAHDVDPVVEKLVKSAPGRGYLEAHRGVEAPLPLLGGPVETTVRQTSGGVHVALPAKRDLDPRVFGTPELPQAVFGTPGINGVPPKAREVEGGRFTRMKKKTPFGDEAIVMAKGRLELRAHDETATDAATTQDTVTFQASWQDGDGNTYAVRCCEKLAAHGVEYPTFGGVVTNHILHGWSRIGTALMPTEYAYVAFWGMGAVLKNGELRAKPRLVHGMLTEYVRTEGYELAHDHEVTPTRRHFHLMVPPMMPDMEEGRFHHESLPTGFELPNGKTLPFWHVMFGNLEIESSRG